MRADEEFESRELREFRAKGCRKNGPGIPIDDRFAAAFAEERTCSNGHRYRGARCIECERNR